MDNEIWFYVITILQKYYSSFDLFQPLKNIKSSLNGKSFIKSWFMIPNMFRGYKDEVMYLSLLLFIFSLFVYEITQDNRARLFFREFYRNRYKREERVLAATLFMLVTQWEEN